MGQKHHKPEEIVAKLRQVEVLAGQGKSRLLGAEFLGRVDEFLEHAEHGCAAHHASGAHDCQAHVAERDLGFLDVLVF